MEPKTAKIRFFGRRKLSSGETDVPIDIDLPLDMPISKLRSELVTSHGFLPIASMLSRDSLSPIPATIPNMPTRSVTVTASPSCAELGGGELFINECEPFKSYFRKICPLAPLTTTIRGNEVIVTDGERDEDSLKISFKRIVEIASDDAADPDGTDPYPHNRGYFPVFNVAQYADKLPADTSKQADMFIAMYGREAMWVRFQAQSPFMVRLHVGGVNAVSGLPSTVVKHAHSIRAGKDVDKRGQDYMVVPPQHWLDGIVTAAGRVEQFVGLPHDVGSSPTHEANGAAGTRRLQFEVIPSRDGHNATAGTSLVWWTPEGHINDKRSPRELEMSPGTVFYVFNSGKGMREVVAGDLVTELGDKGIAKVDLIHMIDGGLLFRVSVDTESGKSITLMCQDSTTISGVKDMLYDKLGTASARQKLVYNKNILENQRSLQSYGIRHGTLLSLFQYVESAGQKIVNVRTLSGSILKIECCLFSDTILVLKRKIEDMEGYLPPGLRLWYQYTRLEDGKTLWDYDINYGDEIKMEIPSNAKPLRMGDVTHTILACTHSAFEHAREALRTRREPRMKSGWSDEYEQDKRAARLQRVTRGMDKWEQAEIMRMLSAEQTNYIGTRDYLIENFYRPSIINTQVVHSTIITDAHAASIWDFGRSRTINIQVVNSVLVQNVTASTIPATPINADRNESWKPFYGLFEDIGPEPMECEVIEYEMIEPVEITSAPTTRTKGLRERFRQIGLKPSGG